jgi:hypothetical protein
MASSDPDAALIAAVSAHLGTDHLPCKHCHGDRPLQAFMGSLKKLWKDGALKRVPRTCDRMQAVNDSQNYANNKIHNTKTSIRRYETRKEEYVAAGKDVTDIETRLADLYVKLAQAIDSKRCLVDEDEHVDAAASPVIASPAIDDPFGIYTAIPDMHVSKSIDDSFGIFSLAALWTPASACEESNESSAWRYF